MNAGRLRHKITLERQGVEPGPSGEQEKTYTAIGGPRRAEVSFDVVREEESAGVIETGMTVTVLMRYTRTVTDELFFSHDGQRFRITGHAPDLKRRWLTIKGERHDRR